MGAWGQIADAIGSVSSPFVSKLSLRGKRGRRGSVAGKDRVSEDGVQKQLGGCGYIGKRREDGVIPPAGCAGVPPKCAARIRRGILRGTGGGGRVSGRG